MNTSSFIRLSTVEYLLYQALKYQRVEKNLQELPIYDVLNIFSYFG